MTETRTITSERVRESCISHSLYTCGTNEEYEKMLTQVYKLSCTDETVTTKDLESIAFDIVLHSHDYNMQEIMFILANECCITLIDEE